MFPFSVFRTVLALQGLLYHHMNFKFYNFREELYWNFIQGYTESICCFSSEGHFHNINLTNPCAWEVSPSSEGFLISLLSIFKFSFYRSFNFLVRLFSYLFLCVATVDGIVSFISFPDPPHIKHVTSIAFYCPPELNGKTLLLKIPYTLVIGHREIIDTDQEDSSLMTSFHGFGRCCAGY